jgi:predicted RNase H-like HicB family nuclease
VKLTIEFEREGETRWIAEVMELPGVLVYGASRAEASTRVKSLALSRVADLLAHGELELDNVIEFEETTQAA